MTTESTEAKARRLLTDQGNLPFVLVDIYLETVEMFGGTVDPKKMREFIRTIRDEPRPEAIDLDALGLT